MNSADVKLIERVRKNLADYQTDRTPQRHAVFAGVFSVNLDEMLELMERLICLAAVAEVHLAAVAEVHQMTGTGWPHA
jgi:hypothetical protein